MRASEYEPPEDEIGPVDFLAVEFPDGRISAADLRELMALVTQGTVRVLDAEFIVKDAAGNARKADAAEFGEPGDLKNAGVLKDAEFEQQKARILNG